MFEETSLNQTIEEGPFACQQNKKKPTYDIFMMKLIYIVGWTSILHYLCKNGYKNLSWFLVLLPFIGMFAIIAMVMLMLL